MVTQERVTALHVLVLFVTAHTAKSKDPQIVAATTAAASPIYITFCTTHSAAFHDGAGFIPTGTVPRFRGTRCPFC